MNVARENMLEWGLELPSVQHLKKGLEMLIELGQMDEDWQFMASHSEVRGDQAVGPIDLIVAPDLIERS